jgi:hypothetical protein
MERERRTEFWAFLVVVAFVGGALGLAVYAGLPGSELGGLLQSALMLVTAQASLYTGSRWHKKVAQVRNDGAAAAALATLPPNGHHGYSVTTSTGPQP